MKAPDEVYFEFQVWGDTVKVTAVEAASGTEATITGPAHASRMDLQQLALRRLMARMQASG